ncbi:T9SS type A sorting domain-containing protein [candidate division KSB1 bacterium]|nr:T9SS type A sorting domain-containing protein [candidate division KSB1 bacterium]
MKKLLLVLSVVFITGVVLGQDGENIVRNGEFDDGRSGWSIRDFNDADQDYEVLEDGLMSGDNYLSVQIILGGDTITDVMVYQSQTLETGRIYQISFMAQASAAHTIQAVLDKGTTTNVVRHWTSPDLVLDGTLQHFGPYEFNCRLEDGSYSFKFLLGTLDNVVVNLDSVVIAMYDDPDHIREDEKFEYRSHTSDTTTIPYRLCQPQDYDPGQSYPLVLALHGAGERGDDNVLPISFHQLAFSWSDSANQAQWPCFVVAPQCPVNERWADQDWSTGSYSVETTPISNEAVTVMDLLDSLIVEFSVDTNRIYITGLSMGGYGTWDLISRFPHFFAAAIPMSGGGDSTVVDRFAHLPIWDFHGENDSTVPVSGSRDMVTALERIGRRCVYTHCHEGDCTGMTEEQVGIEVQNGAGLLYTEWENKGHVMWAESYDYPHLFPWVFAQDKQYPVGVDPVSLLNAPEGFALYPSYPNPFNPVTTISYQLQRDSRILLEVFDTLGRRVKVLIDQDQSAGLHRMQFAGTQLASGSYFICLTVQGRTQIQKMMLVK